MNDPVISEIRRIRAKFAEESGGDFHRFARMIADEAKTLRESGNWRFVSEVPPFPASVLKDEPSLSSNDALKKSKGSDSSKE